MAIRSATVEDVDAIAEVAASSWRWAYQGIVTDELMANQDPAKRAQRLRDRWHRVGLLLVAVDTDGSVVGFAEEYRPPQFEGFDAEIAALYVHADHARAGHGRALVAAMTRAFAERGDRTLCIHTLKENRIGRSFYERIGGVVDRECEWNGLESVLYAWPDLTLLVGCDTS